MGDGFEWEFATTTFTEVVNGYMSVQVDTFGADSTQPTGATAPTMRTHFPYGFFARPRDPDVGPGGTPGTGCTTMYGWEGDNGHAFPLGDPRLDGLLPESPKGSAGMAVLRDDGDYTALRIGGNDGAFVVILHDAKHGDSYMRLDLTDGFDLNTPWFRFQGGPNGVRIKTNGGALLNLTSLGGMPGPLAELSSVAELKGGLVAIGGGAVKLGVDGGLTNQTAVEALLAALVSVEAALVALSTAPAVLGAPPTAVPSVAAAIAAVTTALGVFTPLSTAIGKTF